MLGLLLARRAWQTEGWVDYRGERRRDRIGGRMRKLGLGLLIHDVGKLATPPEILNKPGGLTDQEMEVMREHPEAGRHLLRNAGLSPLTMQVISAHHERPDGLGYPLGLAGDPGAGVPAPRRPSPTSTTPSPPTACTSPPRRPTSACA